MEDATGREMEGGDDENVANLGYNLWREMDEIGPKQCQTLARRLGLNLKYTKYATGSENGGSNNKNGHQGSVRCAHRKNS